MPLGVDTELFSPAIGSGEPAPCRLLAVGSLIAVKGHEQALRVVANLSGDFPNITLDIVGEGPLLPSLRAQAQSLGIADRVTFHGAIPHDQLPRFYQSADIHLLTSQHEAFGMVVLEAAACGLPTVGFALGVLPEFAPHAGVAVPPGDTGALTNAVRSLLCDVDRLREMRQAARTQVEVRYTVKVMALGFKEIYKLA